MKSTREVLQLFKDNRRVAFLKNATDVRVREAVNGDFYVQFIYPRREDDLERYNMLTEQLDIVFPQEVENGQQFRIRKVDEVRQGRKIYKIVEAHHIAFTLGNYFLDDYIDFAAAKTLVEMLTLLGAGTPFTFVVEGSFPAQDIFDFGEDTKINLLQQLRLLYNAELSFNNYEITLTTRKGGNYGARIIHRHNMVGVKRKCHDMERITRLYGYGKNGLTIEGYGGHTVKFIDSPFFDPINPFMGKVEFPEIESQARLLEEMQKHLAKYELPSVSYDADFIQMEKVDREYLDERIREAGDTVTCYDEVLGYSFDARANEFERYPFERKRGRAVLANFREFKTADYIFQATVGSKRAIEYTSKNAVIKGQKYDDSITLVDGMGMLVSDDQGRPMVRLGQTGPGEYGQTMYNKAGAKTIWQDAATGDARFSGKLIAATVEGGVIAGAVVNGGRINGAEMIGSYIATSEDSFPRAEMSETSNMFRVMQSPTNFAEFRANYTSSGGAAVPTLRFVRGSNSLDFGGLGQSGEFGFIADGTVLFVTPQWIVQSTTYFGDWSRIRSSDDNRTLEQELVSIRNSISDVADSVGSLSSAINGKADKGSSTELSPQYNGGIPIGTQIMTGNGTTVTWSGIPAHRHIQV